MNKKISTFIIILIAALLLHGLTSRAQVPQKVSYQSIIRDATGELVKSVAVGVRISILQGSATGIVVYTETHYPTSNYNGLITLEVGTVYPEVFATINWSNSPYFLKVETDPSGGTSFSVTGTSEIISTPYALHAGKADSSVNETDPVFTAWDKSTGITITENQISDLQYYLTDETQSLAAVLSHGSDANAWQIKNVAEPSHFSDAATKNYVDEQWERFKGTTPGEMKFWDGTKWHSVSPGKHNDVLHFCNGVPTWGNCPEAPTISTSPLTNITSTTAIGGGIISVDGGSPIIACGLVWDTDQNPDIDNHLGMTLESTISNEFASNLHSLTPNTIYYVRAYATNSTGTAYGNELQFSSLASIANVLTGEANEITDTSATLSGEITSDGGSIITGRGFVYHTSPGFDPESLGERFVHSANETGTYTICINGLEQNTTYYFVAYATNAVGTAYGNEEAFTTSCPVPARPGSIAGNTTVATSATGETYSIEAVPNATTYTWAVPQGANITHGQGTTEIMVDFGTTGGDISIKAINICGESEAQKLTVEINVVNPVLPTVGLVAWYTFNNNANDESGNGLHGVNNGATSTTDRFGNENSALSFNGTNNYVEVLDNDLLDVNTFTLSCWFYSLSTQEGFIAVKGNSDYNGPFRLYLTTLLTGDTWRNSSASGRVYQVKDYSTMEWHHVILLFDGSVQKLYYDGILIATDNQSGPLNINSDKLLFGKRNSGNFFQGKIDEVRLYNRALTDTEVQIIYNDGNS
ncbi:MAG TPA: hypothetical protein PLK12_04825 [Prolixibacteraceae bacterium]|nr:hypothetical protein [Prolixibacteraceae bacterium]